MLEVLFAMFGPMIAFGLFALLCMRFGAESRPWFDEHPVVDDRPNWFPIAGAGGGDEEDDEDDDEPQGGEPVPVAEPERPRPQPVRVPVASARSAATSPSGV